MLIRKNIKGVATLAIILLMIISAIIGGLISYMFTIALFTEIPGETTLTITGVHFNKEDARSFKISVLNPSYSPTNATIARVALSLADGSELYDFVETDPPIENGIVVPKGEYLNITCFEARKDAADVSWRRLAGEFAGQNITLHVFSQDSPAANTEACVPFVQLHITRVDFNSKVSFNRFNITIMNDVNSEINLTISEIVVGGIELGKDDISPELPRSIANGTQLHFSCNGSWHGTIKTTTTIFTEEGYIFSQEFDLPRASTTIQDVLFNEDYIHYFDVTMFNFAESTNWVNVTKITCTLENGTTVTRKYPSVGIVPNSTYTFRFNWTWKKYRNKKINVTGHLFQGFKTDTYTIITPPSVILRVLNEEEVFDLKNKDHFNITLQNHPSSIEAVNITEIVVKETGEVINGSKAYPELPCGPIEPNQTKSLYCNITDWSHHAGENLTLIINTISEYSGNHTFEFTFALPFAELNITKVVSTTIDKTRYLNITVENLDYSVYNLTVSKVIIIAPNLTEPLEQVFPKNQITVKHGETIALLCVFDWKEHLHENITITVITGEGVEASWQGTSW